MSKKKFYDLRKYWPHLTLVEAKNERQKLEDRQKCKCAICKKDQAQFKKKLAVDHNHKTGRVRGLLCFYCNKFRVGRQTIESCREVLNYLMEFDIPANKETIESKFKKKTKKKRHRRTK